ncbi:N-acetylmuramoyl-L-alanine amidase family protein [Paenibacillus sp. FSL F4-0100]
MMKKAILLLFLSLFFLIILPDQSHASANQSKIILDGQEVILPSDVQVTVMNKHVMIPIRVVAENLKFRVNWDQKSHLVKIQQNSKIISLHVDQREAKVAGKPVLLDIAPQILNKSVVVPIRFVSEQMGLSVSWDNKDKIVHLTSSTNNSAQTEDSTPNSENNEKVSLKHINEINFLNNQLVVSMDGKVTPIISHLKDPNRIVFDLPNTTFGDLSQPLDSGSMGKLDVSGQPHVSEVRYSLFSRDPDQVRIVIELKHANTIQVNHEFIGDQLVIDLNDTGDFESPIQEPLAGERGRKIVMIDPGHGGSDPGTTSISNKHEKDFNLALSLKVQELLLKEPEIEVWMTRDSDVYPTRTERVQLANKINADVFVSIHGNSVLESPQANGTETYYYQRSSSKELADAIHKRLIKAIGLKDRGVKDNSFQVIRETKMPAVLLEVGFLSNISDEKAMLSNTVQYKAAQAIVDGIKEYLSIR